MKTKTGVLWGVGKPLEVAEVELAAPGVAVAPSMLFVNKTAIDGETHGNLTWGAAPADVAREPT